MPEPCDTLERMKLLRWTGNTFIVIGATLLFFVVYELVGTSLVTNGKQDALAAEWDDTIQRPRPLPSSSATAPARPRKYSGRRPPIARLIIPRIGLDRFVVEGTRLSDLVYGPGHYRKTAEPGHAGASAIACHRTGWGSPCINLDRVRTGDEIILETQEGCAQPPCRYVYRMTRSTIVGPDAGHVLSGDPQSSAKGKLTLTTCTPKYTSLRRLIVWADLISPPAETA